MKIDKAHSEMSCRLLHGAIEWEKRMKVAGLKFAYTCVARRIVEQTALYAMGRKSLMVVNDLRTKANMFLITEKENVKVTWTMKSKHIVFPIETLGNHLEKGFVYRNKSDAFDFVILGEKGNCIWDLKVNVNKNQLADYQEAALLAEQVGLVPGIKFGDAPHIEV